MKFGKIVLSAAVAAFAFTSCQTEEAVNINNIEGDILEALADNGFSTTDVVRTETGYLVEGDINMSYDEIMTFVPAAEQYRTTNSVNAGSGRNITISPDSRYDAAMIAGLDEAIARYNAENLTISFTKVASGASADINMNRLRKGEERQGILGSAGFPTASGDPYGEIKMSGILQSTYGLGTNGIATIIAHEMGHCIGFRHTDYFNRGISCGSGGNEGASTVGAIHIPGTPTGATLSAKSFMLSCTDGGDRPFNNDDKTALNYLY